MEIIAKTGEGFLVKASTAEISEILKAVNGVTPKEIEIGQKIPGIDYSTTIIKVQKLKDHYDYKLLKMKIDEFTKQFKQLDEAIESSSNIEI